MTTDTPTANAADPASRASVVPSGQNGLTPEQIASFEENGLLVVRGVVSREELETLSAAEIRLSTFAGLDPVSNPDYLYARNPDDGRMVLFRIGYMQAKSVEFLRLMGHPRILRIGEALQGRNMIAGAGFSMVTKTPGYGAAIAWHVDPANCRVRHGINIGIYLDDADEENGVLWAVPGSHKRTCDLPSLVERHGFHIPGAIPVSVRAGDLIIHSENTLHGSEVTHSQRRRRVVYMGVRTMEEQMQRGFDFAWARPTFRVLHRAIQTRAASETGRGETLFQPNPTFPELHVEVGAEDFVELRTGEGGDRPKR